MSTIPIPLFATWFWCWFRHWPDIEIDRDTDALILMPVVVLFVYCTILL